MKPGLLHELLLVQGPTAGDGFDALDRAQRHAEPGDRIRQLVASIAAPTAPAARARYAGGTAPVRSVMSW
jgi:hypothetical protein